MTHLTSCSCYQRSDYLHLDGTTLRHLEVLDPLHRDAPRTATLYGALNRTVTPMGARCLRDWLSQPLAAVEPITRRQEAVQAWIDQAAALDEFRPPWPTCTTSSAPSAGSASAPATRRDLQALRLSLEQVPGLRHHPGARTNLRRRRIGRRVNCRSRLGDAPAPAEPSRHSVAAGGTRRPVDGMLPTWWS